MKEEEPNKDEAGLLSMKEEPNKGKNALLSDTHKSKDASDDK